MTDIPVEICLDCVTEDQVQRDIEAVVEGGAARVELCANVAVGGLTPAATLVAAARRAAPPSLEILAMIRLRSGNFHVMTPDLEIMVRSVHDVAQAGANGVVFGITRQIQAGTQPDQVKSDSNSVRSEEIDVDGMEVLIQVAQSLELATTFHRAFDTLARPIHSLHQLMDLGIDRVLSSGTPWDSQKPAIQGTDVLQLLAGHAIGQIEIVVGGGIDPGTAIRLSTALRKHTQLFSLHAHGYVLDGERVSASRVARLVNAGHAP